MDPITLLILGGIALATTAASSAVTVANNNKNIKAQQEANQQNIEMQRETNSQNQYNIEHAHQIEMEDLKAAGLNPVLTAMGGSGAPIQSLNSPKVQPVHSDLSGISSALNVIPQMAQTAMMMKMMQNNQVMHNQTLQAIAKGHDATSAANAALRAETLDKLYQRKAVVLSTPKLKRAAFMGMHTAKYKGIHPEGYISDWNKLLEEIDKY